MKIGFREDWFIFSYFLFVKNQTDFLAKIPITAIKIEQNRYTSLVTLF